MWSVEYCHCQWSWMTSNSYFKGTPLFDAEYLGNDIRHKHSYNDIWIGTYTCPTQLCIFEWPWVTSQNFQWHGASHSLSATAELIVHKIKYGKYTSVTILSNNAQIKSHKTTICLYQPEMFPNNYCTVNEL